MNRIIEIELEQMLMVISTMDLWILLTGCMALTSVALSLYEVTMHMCNYTKPYLQRYIIRILFMVPIYSLNAWFAMIVPRTGLYFDTMREVYESFVIYSFMKYLMNFLKHDTNLQQYIEHKPGPPHIVPLCCLPNCVGGPRFLLRCKDGILQYVIFRPITAVVAFASQQMNIYGEGNYNLFSGYTFPVLLLVNNVSQLIAMYGLAIFYTSYQGELRPMRPLAKFFSIKLVVFFSFFQSVVISGLLEMRIVYDTLDGMFPDVTGKVALGRKAQEILICFDMLIAALGHLFAFTYRPFVESDLSRSIRQASNLSPNDRPGPSESRGMESADVAMGRGSYCGALCSILDCSEDTGDFSEHFSQLFNKLAQLICCKRTLPTTVSINSDQSQNGQSSGDWEPIKADNRKGGGSGAGHLTRSAQSEIVIQPSILNNLSV